MCRDKERACVCESLYKNTLWTTSARLAAPTRTILNGSLQIRLISRTTIALTRYGRLIRLRAQQLRQRAPQHFLTRFYLCGHATATDSILLGDGFFIYVYAGATNAQLRRVDLLLLL